MLVYAAAIKFLALIGYMVLLLVCVRSRVAARLKLHFALYLLGLGFWQLTSFILTITRDPHAALFWYNMEVSGLGLQSVIFLPLTRAFLQVRSRRGVSIAAYAACVAVMVVGFLGISFSGVVLGGAGYFIPTLTPAAYGVSLVGYFFWIWGIYGLVSGLRRERLQLQRNRIQYVLIGALTVMAGIATNYTPLKAYPVDTVCALINAVLVTYSVTRYRLMDTGVVLKRALTIMILAALGIGGYILFSYIAAFFVQPQGRWELSLPGLIGLMILLVLSILLGWKSVRPFLDRVAGRRTIGYDRVLEQFSQAARSELDVGKLKSLVVQTAVNGVGSESGCLLFADGADGYSAESVFGPWPRDGFSLSASDDFVRAMRDRKFPLWKQELLINPGLGYLRPMCEPFFEATETSVAIPVIQEEALQGILCLGSKVSDGLYATEDLRFLSTLANVAASTIAVAMNYREVRRQLSIQTFLFVLSESLVRYAGSEKAIATAVGVLKDFLRVEDCFVLALGRAGEVRVHSAQPLSGRLEAQLRLIGGVLASGEGDRQGDPLFADALDASTVYLPWPESETRLVRSLLYLPLSSGSELMGFLALAGGEWESGGGEAAAFSGTFRAILSQGLLSIRHVSELRTLKERYQSLFESVLDAVVTFAEDGELIDTNPAGRELFGIDVLEGGGWNLSLNCRLSPDQFSSLQAELKEHGSIRDFEMRLSGPAGGTRTVLFSGGVDERAPRAIIHGILRDVTEQRELQRQLLQAQKMESIGTMAGGIAHDFNNILTAAIGYAKLIREDIRDPDSALSHLQIVESSMHRATDLTRRLLSFAREGIVDRKPVRINDIVMETVQLLRRSLNLSIDIRTECQPELPAVMGDHGQIHQMLMNLCVNAGDAMPNGGVLGLTTRLKEAVGAREGGLPGAREGRYVLLQVTDTGSGIAASHIPRIFDPFFTTKGPGKGTGLGLSIVYGIVQRHGGRIEVSSVPDRGTTFEVLFPAAEEGPVSQLGSADAAPSAAGHETIMIVDDEVDLRSLVRVTLGSRGYTVIEAADGMEAVEKFRSSPGAIDLVLLDLVMPRLGGRETFQRLRELDPEVKALFATGYGVDSKTEDLLSTGALGIIRKPYEIETVEKEIRRILDAPAR